MSSVVVYYIEVNGGVKIVTIRNIKDNVCICKQSRYKFNIIEKLDIAPNFCCY